MKEVEVMLPLLNAKTITVRMNIQLPFVELDVHYSKICNCCKTFGVLL